MNKFSNRFKNISGDKKLNIFEKLLWFIISFINIHHNSLIDKRIKFKKYIIKNKYKIKIDKFENASPIRIMCNLFWQSINWSEINNIFNKKVQILEIGCGNGRYYEFLKKISSNNNLIYSGLDIKKKNFVESKNKRFILDTADNINKYLDNCNFLITQSAIEHFENDLLFFQKISFFTNKTKKKFLQIHLFPSESCLYTYLFHGYRHYNFGMISKLINSFDEKHQFTVFGIGSKNLNKIVFNKITLKRILNLNIKTINFFDLKNSIDKDNKINDLNKSSFYALIITKNFEIKKLIN